MKYAYAFNHITGMAKDNGNGIYEYANVDIYDFETYSSYENAKSRADEVMNKWDDSDYVIERTRTGLDTVIYDAVMIERVEVSDDGIDINEDTMTIVMCENSITDDLARAMDLAQASYRRYLSFETFEYFSVTHYLNAMKSRDAARDKRY